MDMARRTNKYRPTIPSSYAAETLRPLNCLLFLLPLVVLYEAGLILADPALTPGESSPLAAPQLLEKFFRLFGATGYYLPGFALIAVLLAWHVAAGHPWRVDRWVLAGMAGESLLWAWPLFGINYLIRLRSLAAVGEPNTKLDDLILGVGAGIYEELAFRLIVITVMITILVDVVRIKQVWGTAIAMAISSLLFAAHHYPPVGTDVFDPRDFAFRLLAGGYLAILFVYRGFGVAVGAHAMYNVIVVAI